MARPTSKPRVPTLDPEQASLAFVREVLTELRGGLLKQLVPIASVYPEAVADDELQRTPLYRTVHSIAEYAVHGFPPPRSLASQLAALEPLLRAPLFPPRPLEALVASINPDEETHAIKLVVAAALAREQLAEGSTLITSSQLAVLAGVTRRHVGAAIRAGQLEAATHGRTGSDGATLVQPAEATRWLGERGIAGYTTT